MRRLTDAVSTLACQMERYGKKLDDVRERIIRNETKNHERAIEAIQAELKTSLACAPKPPVERIVTQEVKIQAPVPCEPQIGPEPMCADYAEALAAASVIQGAMRLQGKGG